MFKLLSSVMGGRGDEEQEAEQESGGVFGSLKFRSLKGILSFSPS